MAGVGLQFHAEPRELLGLAGGWAARDGLRVGVERFFPEYSAVEIVAAELSDVAARGEKVDRLLLAVGRLDVRAGSALEMLERNPEFLALLIGTHTDDGLRESWLHGRADGGETLRLWRRIVRRARDGMHRGAHVHGVNTGAVAPRPSHRHTPGAHALAEQGVTMLALAGGNEYVFDDVLVSRSS